MLTSNPPASPPTTPSVSSQSKPPSEERGSSSLQHSSPLHHHQDTLKQGNQTPLLPCEIIQRLPTERTRVGSTVAARRTWRGGLLRRTLPSCSSLGFRRLRDTAPCAGRCTCCCLCPWGAFLPDPRVATGFKSLLKMSPSWRGLPDHLI